MIDIDEPTSGTSTPPAPVVAPKPSARSKWQDEDKEDSEEVRISLLPSILDEAGTETRNETDL